MHTIFLTQGFAEKLRWVKAMKVYLGVIDDLTSEKLK